MKLIIGLGNIGKEYEKTRHNVGFMCLQRLARLSDIKLKNTRLFSYFEYKNSVFILPRTYMNNSGDAYLSALSRYHSFDDVLVVMDDIELPLGDIRVRISGGAGGHNGLKSILQQAGYVPVRRIRIGIGRSGTLTPRDHVLDNFNREERVIIDDKLALVADWLDIYATKGLEAMLDEFSIWKKKPIPPQEGGINRPKEDHE